MGILYDGHNLLTKEFKLTEQEITEGHFLDKIRNHTDYLQKLQNCSKNVLESLCLWAKDKFSFEEKVLVFENKFSEEFIKKFVYKNN
jgi:hypothetical protein